MQSIEIRFYPAPSELCATMRFSKIMNSYW